MEYRKGNHSVYGLNYHIVLVTKYRKPCINNELSERLRIEISRLLNDWESTLIEYESDIDHIHIVAELNPKYSIAQIMAVLKGVTSRIVRRDYSEYLKQYLYGNSFWSDSYFISTSGGVTLDVLKKYVEDQGRIKRKYTKKKKSAVSPPNL